ARRVGLCQLRRLGRKLHGDHRALRWTAGDHRLDRSANWRFGSLRRAACRHWCSEGKRPLAPVKSRLALEYSVSKFGRTTALKSGLGYAAMLLNMLGGP